MKTRDALEIGTKITAGIHFPGSGNGSWSSITWDDPETAWSDELLGRLALLVGQEEVEYASGYVSIESGIAGDIVVFTARRLIRAKFTAQQDQGRQRYILDATVDAESRSAVQRVSAVKTSAISTDLDEEWPRRSSVTVTLKDGESFALPLVNRFPAFDDLVVAGFVSTLIEG